MSTQTEPVGERVSGAAPPKAEEALLTDIAPPHGWQLVDLAELWRFRELVFFLAWRDVKVRYKQTLLGAAWAVLQPALMMVVFTVFFSRIGGIRSSRVPYEVFVYAGLLPWLFVSGAITSAGNSVLSSERLVTRVYFPRLALPLSAVATALVDFGFAFGLLFVLLLWNGLRPGAGLLLVPPVLLLLTVTAVGVGTLLAGLHVAYRDCRYVTPFLIQVWMFVTPAVYLPPERLHADSGWLRLLLALNPLNGLIAAFRAACLGEDVDWGALGLSAALAVVLLGIGCLYFRKVEDRLADII